MTARTRALLALATSALLALLLPTLVLPEPTRAVVALALVVVLVTALPLHRGAVQGLTGLLPVQARAADDDRCPWTGRATDPVHSPLRPRAPGLV